MFDVLVCLLSVTEHFLSQRLVCGTVFHRTSLLPPSPSSALVLNHSSSHFLIPLSDFSHLYSARAVTRHFDTIVAFNLTITIRIAHFTHFQPIILWIRDLCFEYVGLYSILHQSTSEYCALCIQ